MTNFNLTECIRFSQNVVSLSFDEATGLWTITLTDGQFYQARTVIAAQGPLSKFSFPKIDGLENFKGKKMHSANWDHSYEIKGKRFAVIGTGASAIQIIPELVKTADFVKVFQRTPGWVTPRPDYKIPEWQKAVFRRVPAAMYSIIIIKCDSITAQLTYAAT